MFPLFCVGMDYIKRHMEEDLVPSPVSSSGSEVMKGNVQETTRQLDGYLHGHPKVSGHSC